MPSAAPSYVEVSVENSTSVSVQWGPVDCVHQNGEITNYSVRYRKVSINKDDIGGSGCEDWDIEVVWGDSSGGMTTILGLDKKTAYAVAVAAQNSAGTGVFSNPQIFHTPDGTAYFILVLAHFT